jgi:hypothetical protein
LPGQSPGRLLVHQYVLEVVATDAEGFDERGLDAELQRVGQMFVGLERDAQERQFA